MPRAVAQLGSALDWGSRGRRFKSCQPDKCDVARHRNTPNLWFRGISLCLGLVVLGGVEGEFSDEFACFLVDDADVEAVDEHDDFGVFVGSSDADVVEFSGVAEGDDAGGVDFVVADS